ncbi:GntR family transcriptional regulator [Streptomyces ipomoeae]|uniref:GntR family transcriptional regulator n=1 Tax=Streptomyces ipomoeae TaxID=103232 RepID=A0AAE8VZ29_9ACTN|nr:GntR family transcriptional regulator [Streptomyces ipomoeae]TQE27788.1 GntR family transcriptional regulator [Streptomyces ipomoeae]
MSQQASPRGTFLKVADAVKAQIEADPEMTELPTAAELMRDHGVSRGVALRAFGALQKDGLAEPVPGGRWRVIRAGQHEDRRPLTERITDLIDMDGLKVGAPFPSASALSARFGVSRPTVSKALDKLEAAGWLSEGGQGKVRTVRAVPSREGRSQP